MTIAVLIAAVALALIAYSQFQADAFVLYGYEVDSLHAIDSVARLASGDTPHVDYPTALGYLAFAPVSFFAHIGLPIGAAFVASQFLVAGCILLAALWVGVSRLNAPAALVLLLSIIFVTTAVTIHVDPDEVTFGGHYNRWAWSVAFVLITISFLPGRSERAASVDGIVIGTGYLCLLLLKVTFVIGLAPFTVFLLAKSGRWRTFAAAAVTGGILILGWTVYFGLGYWISYAENLVWVSSGELRPYAGNSLSDLSLHPIVASCALLTFATSVFLAIRDTIANAIGFLVLAIGCFFIAYQNFGNLPLWIVAQTIVLIALFPRLEVRNKLLPLISYLSLTLGSLAISANLLFGMAVSALRGPASDNVTDAVALFEASLTVVEASDIKASHSRLTRIEETRADRCDDPAILRPVLEIADELAGLEGAVFVADVVAPYWLFGVGQRVPGSPPWNYGSLRGLENANYILVPICPFREPHSKSIVRRLDQLGMLKQPIVSSAWFALYSNTNTETKESRFGDD